MDSIKLLVLEELWRKEPQSKVFLRLAEELRKSGQYERAIAVCKEGLPNQPGYVPALVSLGRSTQALGQSREAENVFSQVLELAPDNTHALRGMGQLLADRGDYGQGIRYLETLLLHEPNDTAVIQRLEHLRRQIELESAASIELEENPADESSISSTSKSNDEEAVPSSHEDEQSDIDAPEAVDDSLANLDREFELALENAGEDADLFQEGEALTGEFDISDLSPTDVLDEKVMEEDLETMITQGLKHEKMEHLEQAEEIYRLLLDRHPNDILVREHLERVLNLIASETPGARKIRVLSNWLDKIKGVYHVS